MISRKKKNKANTKLQKAMFHIILLVIWLSLGCSSAPIQSRDQGGPAGENGPPEFLLRLHTCLGLRNKGDVAGAKKCMEFAGHMQQNIINQMNAVWGFVGNWTNEISFDINKKTLNEDILSVDLVLYRAWALSEEELENLDCDMNSDESIQLQLIVNETTVISTISLTRDYLLRTSKEWIGFHHLEHWYTNSLQGSKEGSGKNIRIDFKIQPTGNCSNLSLSRLGFTDSPGYQPLLVVYTSVTKVSDIEKDVGYNLLENIGKAFEKRRKKKQVVEKTTTTNSGTVPVDQTEHCRVVEFNVSYALLNSPTPGTFNLNFCSGHCFYPLKKGTSNHAHLLAFLNSGGYEIPEKPQLPCCSAARYQPLDVLVAESKTSTTFVLVNYHEMTVVDCSCK